MILFQPPVLCLHPLLHRLVQHRYPQVSSMQGVPRKVQGWHVGLCEHEELQVEGSKVDERQIA